MLRSFLILVSSASFVIFLLWGIVSLFRRTKKARWSFLISLLSLVILCIATPIKDSKPIAEKDSSQESQQKTVATNETLTESQPLSSSRSNKGINVTIQEFSNNFNSIAEAEKLNYKIEKFNIERGQANVDTFKYQLTDNVGIMGTIKKTDNILSFVQVLMIPDGTDQSGIDLTNVMGILTKLTNDRLSRDEVISINSDLVNYLSDDSTRLEKKIVKDEIEYKIMRTKFGIIFRVSKAK